jgi:hypothetical protein
VYNTLWLQRCFNINKASESGARYLQGKYQQRELMQYGQQEEMVAQLPLPSSHRVSLERKLKNGSIEDPLYDE